MLHEDLGKHIILEFTARISGSTHLDLFESEVNAVEVLTWI